MRANLLRIVAIGLCVLMSKSIRAADAPTSQPSTIGSDDLIDVAIDDIAAPGVTTVFHERVDSTGTIHLPILGTMTVKGNKISDLQARVEKALIDKKLMAKPKVLIGRSEIGATATTRSGPIASGDRVRIVIWEVTGPGEMAVIDQAIDEKRLSQWFRCSARVTVIGLTEAKVEQTIGDAYHAKRILEDAMVECLRIAPPTTSSAK